MTTTNHTPLPSAKCGMLSMLTVCALWAPLHVHAQAAGGTEVAPGISINAAAAAKIEKMSSDPFRWIILHANTVRTPQPAEAPAGSPSKPRAAPVRAAAPRAAPVKPTETLAIATPKAQVNTPPTAVGDQGVSEGSVLLKVIDFATAKIRDDGGVETASGAYVSARVNTYSAKSPNPVEASSSFDSKRKLVRVDYSVPDTVGSSGGAGIRINVPGEGVELKQLVNGDNVDGMLVIDIDATEATSLKIALLGPAEHPQGAYPYFRLPVEPGLHTYGLMLADFAQAPWSSTAADIATALSNVIGIEVEYSRGYALGKADKGSFWVGNIRISKLQQLAATSK